MHPPARRSSAWSPWTWSALALLSACAGTSPRPPAFTFELPSDPSPASRAQLEQELAAARASGKPVLVVFHAGWCGGCRILDRETFANHDVRKALTRFVTIRIDASNDDDPLQELGQRFGARGLPTVAFIASTGEILAAPHVTGVVGPDAFVVELGRVP